jgi:hypothetical protein
MKFSGASPDLSYAFNAGHTLEGRKSTYALQ